MKGSGLTAEAVEDKISSGVQRGGRYTVEQLCGYAQNKRVHQDCRCCRIKVATDRVDINSPTDARLDARTILGPTCRNDAPRCNIIVTARANGRRQRD